MNVQELAIPGVKLVRPPRFGDARGYFTELWREASYRAEVVDRPFVQTNLSSSSAGVLRGLHFQLPTPQGKLVTCLRGAIWDVAADIRPGSPTFGQWVGETLTGENGRQLYIPEGFAHGFCVVGDEALVMYQCTALYDPAGDAAVRWDDPDLAIVWPIANPLVSPKDAAAPFLDDLPAR